MTKVSGRNRRFEQIKKMEREFFTLSDADFKKAKGLFMDQFKKQRGD